MRPTAAHRCAPPAEHPPGCTGGPTPAAAAWPWQQAPGGPPRSWPSLFRPLQPPAPWLLEERRHGVAAAAAAAVAAVVVCCAPEVRSHCKICGAQGGRAARLEGSLASGVGHSAVPVFADMQLRQSVLLVNKRRWGQPRRNLWAHAARAAWTGGACKGDSGKRRQRRQQRRRGQRQHRGAHLRPAAAPAPVKLASARPWLAGQG